MNAHKQSKNLFSNKYNNNDILYGVRHTKHACIRLGIPIWDSRLYHMCAKVSACDRRQLDACGPKSCALTLPMYMLNWHPSYHTKFIYFQHCIKRVDFHFILDGWGLYYIFWCPFPCIEVTIQILFRERDSGDVVVHICSSR